MTAPNDTPNGDKNVTNGAARQLSVETIDGKLAALMTITGMEHDASRPIVDEIESTIRRELNPLIREGN